MKKQNTILLLSALAITLLSGCGGGVTESKNEKSKKPPYLIAAYSGGRLVYSGLSKEAPTRGNDGIKFIDSCKDNVEVLLNVPIVMTQPKITPSCTEVNLKS